VRNLGLNSATEKQRPVAPKKSRSPSLGPILPSHPFVHHPNIHGNTLRICTSQTHTQFKPISREENNRNDYTTNCIKRIFLDSAREEDKWNLSKTQECMLNDHKVNIKWFKSELPFLPSPTSCHCCFGGKVCTTDCWSGRKNNWTYLLSGWNQAPSFWFKHKTFDWLWFAAKKKDYWEKVWVDRQI
jgi:hypothetical protein